MPEAKKGGKKGDEHKLTKKLKVGRGWDEMGSLAGCSAAAMGHRSACVMPAYLFQKP